MNHNGFGGLPRALPHEHEATSSSQSSSMADFDEAAYRPYLDGLDITDEQGSALMRIVHDIMRMFVEMDLPVDICGQILESILHPNQNEPDSRESLSGHKLSHRSRIRSSR